MKKATRSRGRPVTWTSPRYPLAQTPSTKNFHPAYRRVGALLVYLLARDLPLAERQMGWSLVERWLREVAESKRAAQSVGVAR